MYEDSGTIVLLIVFVFILTALKCACAIARKSPARSPTPNPRPVRNEVRNPVSIRPTAPPIAPSPIYTIETHNERTNNNRLQRRISREPSKDGLPSYEEAVSMPLPQPHNDSPA